MRRRRGWRSSPRPRRRSPATHRTLPRLADLLHLGDAGLTALLGDWLEGVYTATDLDAALAARSSLTHGEVIMTREGHAVSQFAVSFYAPDSQQAGLLARAQEIENLEKQTRAQAILLDEAKSRLVRAEAESSDAAERLAASRKESARGAVGGASAAGRAAAPDAAGRADQPAARAAERRARHARAGDRRAERAPRRRREPLRGARRRARRRPGTARRARRGGPRRRARPRRGARRRPLRSSARPRRRSSSSARWSARTRRARPLDRDGGRSSSKPTAPPTPRSPPTSSA